MKLKVWYLKDLSLRRSVSSSGYELLGMNDIYVSEVHTNVPSIVFFPYQHHVGYPGKVFFLQ